MKKSFYTITQTAEMLQVNHKTVRRWIQDGKLKAYQPGGRKGTMLIPAGSITLLLKNSEVQKNLTPPQTGRYHCNHG